MDAQTPNYACDSLLEGKNIIVDVPRARREGDWAANQAVDHLVAVYNDSISRRQKLS